MALSGLHRDWRNGSYLADRDYLIKKLENPKLANGDLSGLRPHWDGYRSIAIGYGLDLFVNSNTTINNYLTAAGLSTLSPEDEAPESISDFDTKQQISFVSNL